MFVMTQNFSFPGPKNRIMQGPGVKFFMLKIDSIIFVLFPQSQLPNKTKKDFSLIGCAKNA